MKNNLSKGLIKIFTIFVVFSFVISGMSGCGTNTDKNNEKKLNIVAANFTTYDFARRIAGNKAKVQLLIPPGSDSHSFEPNASHIKAIGNADLAIGVGGAEDNWLQKAIKDTGKKKKLVTMLDMVDESDLQKGHHHHHGESEKSEHHGDAKHNHKGEAENHHDGKDLENHEAGDKHDEHHDEDSGEHHEDADTHHDEDHEHDSNNESDDKLAKYDPHVWLSLHLSHHIVEGFGERLSDIDKKNAEYYRNNAKSFAGEIENLETEYQNLVKDAKRRKIVVADKFPFKYLFKELGLKHEAAYDGHTSDSEISARNIKKMINVVKNEKLPCVYHIEFSDKKIANAVSEGTGAKLVELHSCHTVSKTEFDKGVTYLDIMKRNLEALKKGLY